MATETRERAENDADATELATKADLEAVSEKVEDVSGTVEDLSEKFERLSETVENLVVEVAKLQVGQKWIAWILGVMCAALFAIFATLVVIALQL